MTFKDDFFKRGLHKDNASKSIPTPSKEFAEVREVSRIFGDALAHIMPPDSAFQIEHQVDNSCAFDDINNQFDGKLVLVNNLDSELSQCTLFIFQKEFFLDEFLSFTDPTYRTQFSDALDKGQMVTFSEPTGEDE